MCKVKSVRIDRERERCNPVEICLLLPRQCVRAKSSFFFLLSVPASSQHGVYGKLFRQRGVLCVIVPCSAGGRLSAMPAGGVCEGISLRREEKKVGRCALQKGVCLLPGERRDRRE